MAKDPIFPVYYNDIDRSTRDWTDEEFGAYMRLLMHQWDKFGLPLGFDRLSRIAPSVEKNWGVLEPKFRLVDGQLKNDRLEEIRAERLIFKQKQGENGRKGGRPKKPTESQSETQTQTQTEPKKKPLEDEVEYEEEVLKEDKVEDLANSEKLRFLPGSFLTEMSDLWQASLPDYTRDPDHDLKALLSIAQFIFKNAGIANGLGDADHQITALNTFQLIADQVNREEFWKTKSLKSIASHIQEFYNKIKSPNNGTAKQKPSGGSKLDPDKIKAALARNNAERQQAGG